MAFWWETRSSRLRLTACSTACSLTACLPASQAGSSLSLSSGCPLLCSPLLLSKNLSSLSLSGGAGRQADGDLTCSSHLTEKQELKAAHLTASETGVRTGQVWWWWGLKRDSQNCLAAAWLGTQSHLLSFSDGGGKWRGKI